MRGPSTLWHKHQRFTEAVCMWLRKPLSLPFTLEFPCTQNIREYSSVAKWTRFTLKQRTENGRRKPLNLTFVGALVGEDTSSYHDDNGSDFWHYRRLAGFWNDADQMATKVTNLQGHIGNYKTLSTAESLLCLLWMLRILLVALCFSTFFYGDSDFKGMENTGVIFPWKTFIKAKTVKSAGHR